MVLEIAILDVKPGQESSFERDFSVASGCITTVNGYISHELPRRRPVSRNAAEP